MPDLLLVLIVILIVALVARGPKTLPQLGAMFGRGVRDTRRELRKGESADEPHDSTTPGA